MSDTDDLLSRTRCLHQKSETERILYGTCWPCRQRLGEFASSEPGSEHTPASVRASGGLISITPNVPEIGGQGCVLATLPQPCDQRCADVADLDREVARSENAFARFRRCFRKDRT